MSNELLMMLAKARGPEKVMPDAHALLEIVRKMSAQELAHAVVDASSIIILVAAMESVVNDKTRVAVSIARAISMALDEVAEDAIGTADAGKLMQVMQATAEVTTPKNVIFMNTNLSINH